MQHKSGLALFLEKTRERQGITQRALDIKAGLPKGTVSQLESGSKLFSDIRINKLASALDISPDDFLIAIDMKRSPERKLVDEECDDLSRDELLEVALMLRNWKKDKRRVDSDS